MRKICNNFIRNKKDTDMKKIEDAINDGEFPNLKCGSYSYILHYPEDIKHIQFNVYDTPFTIFRGKDSFWYYNENGKNTETKQHLWYVDCKGKLYLNNGFVKLESALNATLKKYKKELQNQLDISNRILLGLK